MPRGSNERATTTAAFSFSGIHVIKVITQEKDPFSAGAVVCLAMTQQKRLIVLTTTPAGAARHSQKDIKEGNKPLTKAVWNVLVEGAPWRGFITEAVPQRGFVCSSL